ncbi:MAG: hypothetical protein HYX57_01130 [Chloroflexi bacterium]|nr:hypothetical protein [Chloroflexota bacterium]
MDALLAAAAALLALAGSVAVLRSFGSRYRVGRLLAAAPRVSVAEAAELAHRGHAPYVRIDGRIDSEAEFEDLDHRPLVLRRTRLQVRRGGRWVDFETNHEVVPFEIAEGLDSIAIDGANLTDGLVVVPRETVGTVGDLADRAPDELDDALPARVVVEQLSSVEHATALGVPALDANGVPALGPGLGRPLIVSTLEGPEAMRVLAGGRTGRPRAAAALLAIAAVLLIAAFVLFVVPGDVLGASPSPPAITGSDTRSAGQGPGFVGALGPAFLAVIGIAVITIALTLAFVRVTGGPKPLEPPRRR